MKVKLIRDWNGIGSGFVFENMIPGQAELLIARGFAKEVKLNVKRDATSEDQQPDNVSDHVKRGKKASKR